MKELQARPERERETRSALVVIDVLNRYEHEDAEPLVRSMEAALPGMREALERARAQQALVIYVNDNYGDWSAGRAELLERALAGPHADLVAPLAPGPDTAFIVKARHSAFYETQLEYLLRRSGIERLALIGQVTEQCILYSALDAYVRHYSLIVPRDAVAHIYADLGAAALRMMRRNMRVDIVSARDLELGAGIDEADAERGQA